MDEIPESLRDLLANHIGVLTTNGRSGVPHMSPVWFLVEDDIVRVSLNTIRQKVANLRRDPRCSFLVLDFTNPLRYLEFRGTAVLEDDPDYVFADRVGAKYGGDDLRTRDQPGESRVVVTITASRIIAVGA